MRHFQMAKKVWLQFYIVSTNSRRTFMSLNLNDYLQIISAHVLPTFCIVGQNLMLTVLNSTLWRRMAQKVIEGVMSHVKSYAAYHMHEKSRLLKFRSLVSLRWLTFSIIKTEMGQKSWKTRDRDFEPFWNWAISISHAYDFTWDMSPSMTFFQPSHHTVWSIPPVKLKKSRTVFWELNHKNLLWTFAWAFQ